jgi:hypothetical protein
MCYVFGIAIAYFEKKIPITLKEGQIGGDYG